MSDTVNGIWLDIAASLAELNWSARIISSPETISILVLEDENTLNRVDKLMSAFSLSEVRKANNSISFEFRSEIVNLIFVDSFSSGDI